MSKANFKYSEAPPSPELKSVIRNSWTFEYNGNHLRNDYILPSGMVYFFYVKTEADYDAHFLYTDHRSRITNNTFYLGYINSPVEFKHPNIQLTGVAIFPIYLEAFLKDGANLLLNKFIPVQSLGISLSSQSCNNSPKLIIETLEEYINKHLDRAIVDDELLNIYKGIAEIKEYKGSIESLSHLTKCSPRQLNNLFRRHLGLSPKRFLQLVRFNHGLQLIEQHTNLITVAHELGYHDQSHFIKDFKKMSGKTPKELMEESDTISKNFRLY